MSEPSDREIARALAWIEQNGSLTGFPCMESDVLPLWKSIKGRKLAKLKPKSIMHGLTPAGDAFVRVMQRGDPDV